MQGKLKILFLWCLLILAGLGAGPATSTANP
jgi:hypothetical protein